MSDLKWIKLSTDIFENRKIRQIECMPNGDAILAVWLKLLCFAGKTNDSGLIYFTKEIPYTETALAAQFNKPLETITNALSIFTQYGMIEIIDGIICVVNWEKYQNVESMEKLKAQNRLRQEKYRAKQKNAHSNVMRNVTVTLRNATEEDIRKKNKKEEYIPPIIPQGDNANAFDLFWKAYPKKVGKEAARKAFAKAKVSIDTLVTAVEQQKKSEQWCKDNGQYIPNPATWLNQGRWEDELNSGNYSAELNDLDDVF